MLCWMLDVVLLSAGAVLFEDARTVTVSAGLLTEQQKERTASRQGCEPGRNVPFRQGFPLQGSLPVPTRKAHVVMLLQAQEADRV